MAIEINRNIKIIREMRNYTQEYVAEKLGMTQAGYCKIEKGISNLSLEKLNEIADILEVNVESIIQFESEWYFKNSCNEIETFKNPENTSSCKLLKEKIVLLEKLLHKTDLELRRYRKKFGSLSL